MFNRLMQQGLLVVMLAIGPAAAHANNPSPTHGGDHPSPVGLHLTLHFPQQPGPAAPDAGAPAAVDVDAPANLHGTTDAPACDVSEHRLAPGVDMLTGYDPYTVFDALDFKPRAGDYALGLKFDFNAP